jgi:hypothetical protein
MFIFFMIADMYLPYFEFQGQFGGECFTLDIMFVIIMTFLSQIYEVYVRPSSQFAVC